MRSPDEPQSTTSLPRAPRDGEAARSRRYLVTMGIRIGCFILAVVIQPFGWWTWVMLAGAIFLPYIAVVMANVGMDARAAPAQRPDRMLPAAPSAPTPTEAPRIIRLAESPNGDPENRDAENRDAADLPPDVEKSA